MLTIIYSPTYNECECMLDISYYIFNIQIHYFLKDGKSWNVFEILVQVMSDSDTQLPKKWAFGRHSLLFFRINVTYTEAWKTKHFKLKSFKMKKKICSNLKIMAAAGLIHQIKFYYHFISFSQVFRVAFFYFFRYYCRG